MAQLASNGGLLLSGLRLPDFCDYAVQVTKRGAADTEARSVQGQFIREVIQLNSANFRVFSTSDTL